MYPPQQMPPHNHHQPSMITPHTNTNSISSMPPTYSYKHHANQFSFDGKSVAYKFLLIQGADGMWHGGRKNGTILVDAQTVPGIPSIRCVRAVVRSFGGQVFQRDYELISDNWFLEIQLANVFIERMNTYDGVRWNDYRTVKMTDTGELATQMMVEYPHTSVVFDTKYLQAVSQHTWVVNYALSGNFVFTHVFDPTFKTYYVLTLIEFLKKKMYQDMGQTPNAISIRFNNEDVYDHRYINIMMPYNNINHNPSFTLTNNDTVSHTTTISDTESDEYEEDGVVIIQNTIPKDPRSPSPEIKRTPMQQLCDALFVTISPSSSSSLSSSSSTQPVAIAPPPPSPAMSS